MLITTKANIKALLDIQGSRDEILLNAIALSVSRRCELFCGRLFETTERTQYFNVVSGEKAFQLNAYPVSSVSGVYNDYDRSYNTEIDSDLYTTTDTGLLIIDQYSLVAGAKTLKIVYTGGLAESQTSLQSAYPELEMSCRMQGAYQYERRQKQGVIAETFEGGNIRYREKSDILPEVKAIWDEYRTM